MLFLAVVMDFVLRVLLKISLYLYQRRQKYALIFEQVFYMHVATKNFVQIVARTTTMWNFMAM
jgi:hypothetical protein